MGLNAKEVFEKFVAKLIAGKTSDETISIFCELDYNFFFNIAKKHRLRERQISALVGFKDEFFVQKIVEQIIEELGFNDTFYAKKITANRNSGLKARQVSGSGDIVTLGGDCVVFRKTDNKPLLIIECKEYIDMIRMKELIGESRVIKDKILGSRNLLGTVEFCVFAEVLELTPEWAALLNNSDLRYKIDKIFVVRTGKRKDKGNKPNQAKLQEFKSYIVDFLKKNLPKDSRPL